MSYYDYYPAYVSVAEKRRRSIKALKKFMGNGNAPQPVELESRMIATTFWGKAWCENLEQYSDMENRLPRGRTYVRNGSVLHLVIKANEVLAYVSGSQLYTVKLLMDPLEPGHWAELRNACSGGIGSLVELLQGKLSDAVMGHICEKDKGLFPKPKEIKMSCSCPDYAGVCKHIAAVIYGIGARLDKQPELLFRMRQVNEKELISAAQQLKIPKASSKRALVSDDLSALFGIEMAAADTEVVAKVMKPVKQVAAPKKKAKMKIMATVSAPGMKVAKKAVAQPKGLAKAEKKDGKRSIANAAPGAMKVVRMAVVKVAAPKRKGAKKAVQKVAMPKKKAAKTVAPKTAIKKTVRKAISAKMEPAISTKKGAKKKAAKATGAGKMQGGKSRPT
ncbi:MAG: SWIM zinc finger family protein [Flavobacteriales bacterium]